MSRAVVAGGAGFLGSHFCRRLLAEGWDVLCLDSLLTGSEDNLEEIADNSLFRFENADVTDSVTVEGPVELVAHFASPASPVDYLNYPVETLKVGSHGTLNALHLALDKEAVFFMSSTSEVYGDPKEHPQHESYWGNVNPVGPRSVYDEAKRYAEALTMVFHRTHGLPVRIARIFNTYGPRMRRNDGRAVPNFISQALRGEPITVHGDGSQTRSLCFVDDEIDGLYRLATSDETGPMNIGNPEEITIIELAHRIIAETGSGSDVVFVERPVDDPENRCPDIGLAMAALGWKPQVDLREGIARTVEWARRVWS